jgi:predicted N-acyltransferase
MRPEWTDTLDQVERDEWDRLADGDAFYLTHGWLRRLEDKADRTVRYALLRRGGTLVAALPVYDVPAETGAYDPARLAELTGLAGPVMIAGAGRGQRNTLLLAPQLSEVDACDAVAALARAARGLAVERGAAGVVFPFLTTDSLRRLMAAEPVRAAYDDVDAQITGLRDGLPGYLAALSRARRQRITREMRGFAAAGWRVQEERLGDCWSELAALLFQVQEKYGHSPSVERYRTLLRRQADLLDDVSVVFGIREPDGRLVGALLAYRWRDCLYARLVGFDYARLRDATEYFNVAYYHPIDYAGRHGLSRLHLGPGAYEAKLLRGAELRPLWTAALPASGAAAPALLNWPAAAGGVAARFGDHPRALPPEHWHPDLPLRRSGP